MKYPLRRHDYGLRMATALFIQDCNSNFQAEAEELPRRVAVSFSGARHRIPSSDVQRPMSQCFKLVLFQAVDPFDQAFLELSGRVLNVGKSATTANYGQASDR